MKSLSQSALAALLWVFAACAALVSVSVCAQDLETGLVAHYELDGDATDSGPNGYNGRTTGSPVYRRGMVGDALSFDGNNDSIQFLGIPNTVWAGSFSVSWFMRAADLERYSLLSKRTACTGGNYFDVRLGIGSREQIGFELSRTLQPTPALATAPIEIGPWVHVTVVRTTTTARVYVDGDPGTSAALGALDFSAITAALGFGESPCVGGADGTLPFHGELDEVRVYNRALSTTEIETLARLPSLTVAPASGPVATRLRAMANNLVSGRNYELRLKSRSVDQQLVAFTAVGTSASPAATIPNVAAGVYSIVLRERSVLVIGGGTVLRSVPFTVTSRLNVVSRSATIQAGRSLVVDVSGLTSGSLQLKHAGRIVAGPTPIRTATQTLRYIVPADIPTNLPATVTLQAEQLSARMVTNIGTTTVNVTPAFTGPFVTVSGLTSSNPNPRPSDPVRLTGRLNLADGATTNDVEVSAYWTGTNGQVTPLSTSDLTMQTDGNFTLDTRPAGYGTMTSNVPSGSGRVSVVTSRTNLVTGRRELEVATGPSQQTTLDSDPQTDITIRVRARVGGGGTVPLAGAYAVLDADAPVQLYQSPRPSGGFEANYTTPDARFVSTQQPGYSFTQFGITAQNQLTESTVDLSMPGPTCGTSLYRRYTDATGRAEFLIQGEQNGVPSNFQSARSTRFRAVDCSAGGCASGGIDPVYEFYLTVYTLHLGAGYRAAGNSNVEVPSRFHFRYDRNAHSFVISDLRTGTTTTQQNSVNLVVEVPAITQLDGYITIADPIVFQQAGTSVYTVPLQSGTFGRWIDFADLAGQFLNDIPPTRVIRFSHKPTTAGSITSARLMMPNLNTGQPSQVGVFTRITTVEGCNIQDDPNDMQAETWELRIDGTLSLSWRFPQTVYYRPDSADKRICGFIETHNAQGGDGRRNICFGWQALPESLTQNAGSLLVDDSNLNDVRFDRGIALNDKSTSITLPSQIDGEDVDEPHQRRNRTRTSRSSFDRITAYGPAAAGRLFAGTNPEQFTNDAAGRTSEGGLSSGSNSLTIGTDNYRAIVDETIPLFGWTWGVPGLFGADAYVDLRLLADYYYYGRLRRINNAESLDLTTDARFGIYINGGVDIDVLFGLVFDAGAFVTGYALSTMPTVIEDNDLVASGPCFGFGLTFTGYIDPCPLCPTPRYEDTVPIINEVRPNNCAFYDGPDQARSLLQPKGGFAVSPVTGLEQRQMRRHPALAFDSDGNGQMLMLDNAQSLVVSTLGAGPAPWVTLSTAPNARQAQVAYYAPDRAIAVWVESALSVSALATADIATLARNQRVAWARFNGSGWLPKQYLTSPGMGEAFPALVACPSGQSGCPSGGEVALVWQRNESGDYLNPRHRLHYARYKPATGWSSPTEVAPTGTSVQDITPTIGYLGANPHIMWVRQTGSSLNNLAQRRLAFRTIGLGTAQEVTSLPTGVLSPSMATRTGTGANVIVSFMKVDPGTGPIGTRQALHTAEGTCSGGSCSWTWRRALDPWGRAIYGERPQTLATSGNDAVITMRGFQFRGADGEPVRQGDPIGTVISSGDLLSVRVNAATGSARTVAITADGATHFGVAAAYDPLSESVVTAASTYLPPNQRVPMAALKAAGYESQVAMGKSIATVGNLEVLALDDVPDLVVEEVRTSTNGTAPGAGMVVTVRIGNRGGSYDTARDGSSRIELRLDAVTSRTAPLGTATLASLGAGASRDVVLNITLPSTAFADEPHVLYASVITADDLVELSGDNNVGTREFAGLPVPQSLASFSTPGIAAMQLGWTAPTDARVAGYRIYRQDGQAWVPLGSSPNQGFLDVSAQFDVPRTYAVSSYSARGVESERSGPLTVMPVVATVTDDPVFADSFESL